MKNLKKNKYKSKRNLKNYMKKNKKFGAPKYREVTVHDTGMLVMKTF